jgi:hypothetical protein
MRPGNLLFLPSYCEDLKVYSSGARQWLCGDRGFGEGSILGSCLLLQSCDFPLQFRPATVRYLKHNVA